MGKKILDIDGIRETFKEFLTSKGLRVTNQRLAIFDAAYQYEDHFTAGLRDVPQPAVYAEEVRRVVVLDDVAPGPARVERDVRA